MCRAMQRRIYPNQHRVSKPIHPLKGGVIWGILNRLSTSTIKLSQRRDYRDNLISRAIGYFIDLPRSWQVLTQRPSSNIYNIVG